jgi:MFS family permease
MGYPENVIREQIAPWKNLKEGFFYVWKEPTLRSLIVMALVVEAFAWSHITMLPVMARDVLDVGASGFGLLSSSSGIGLMIGTLTMASLGDIKNKGRWVVLFSLGFGLFILLFSISTWFPLSMLLIAIALAMGISCDAMLSTLLQILSDNRMRGRVVSFYGLTFGMTPMGGFGEGIIANLINAPLAVGLGGGLVILNSIRLIMQGLAPRIQIALYKKQETS